MDGCKKYKLNSYRILRALRQRVFNLRQKMLLKIQDKSESGKPLLLFKISTGGRSDFYRDVDEFEREEKIKSVLLKHETYHFHFCDFLVSTQSTTYMLVSQQDPEDAISYIQDVFHQFMIDVSADENTSTTEYTQKVLDAYKNCYAMIKSDVNDIFPELTNGNWIKSEKVLVVKPKLGEPADKDSDRIFNAISSLYESDIIADFFYMWHSEKNADVNGVVQLTIKTQN